MANRKCSVCGKMLPEENLMKNDKKKWVCLSCAIKVSDDSKADEELDSFLEKLADKFDDCDVRSLQYNVGKLKTHYKYSSQDILDTLKYVVRYGNIRDFNCRGLINYVTYNYYLAQQFKSSLQNAKDFNITTEILESLAKEDEIHTSLLLIEEQKELEYQKIINKHYGNYIDIDSLPDDDEYLEDGNGNYSILKKEEE